MGVFNVGFTDPTQAATGFVVSRDARPTIHRDLIHPPALYPRLRDRFGAWTVLTAAQTKAEWMSVMPRETQTRTEVLSELLRTRPWRFALAHLPEIAFAQHRFWNDTSDTLRSVYATVDRAIAKLVEAAGPETIVFLFSECGAGPIRHGVQLNAWLEREGYLVRRYHPVQRLARAGARAHTRVRRLLPRGIPLTGFKMRLRATVNASSVDWSRTRASSPGDASEIIFNVPAAERGALTDELRSRLLTLRDPEGRRVVEDVVPREAWGAQRDRAADLTIVWEDDAYMPADNFEERGRVFVDWCPEFVDWTFTGSHRREGMLLVSGPGIGRVDLGRVRTVDLAPTWLELLGVSPPRELEGSSFAARLISG